MLDLQSATDALSALVRGVRDDQLGLPTPSAGRAVADLLDHIDGFSIGFAAAAAKSSLDSTPPRVPRSADGSRLGGDWGSASRSGSTAWPVPGGRTPRGQG